ncbi:MAG: hypothetical protein WKF78_07540 [Candidatus Limnocylindrales bacterium]
MAASLQPELGGRRQQLDANGHGQRRRHDRLVHGHGQRHRGFERPFDNGCRDGDGTACRPRLHAQRLAHESDRDAGLTASYTVSITPSGGFTGSVNLSVSGMPTGAGWLFSPNPATSLSTLSVTTSGTTSTGTYPRRSPASAAASPARRA